MATEKQKAAEIRRAETQNAADIRRAKKLQESRRTYTQQIKDLRRANSWILKSILGSYGSWIHGGDEWWDLNLTYTSLKEVSVEALRKCISESDKYLWPVILPKLSKYLQLVSDKDILSLYDTELGVYYLKSRGDMSECIPQKWDLYVNQAQWLIENIETQKRTHLIYKQLCALSTFLNEE